MILLNALPFPSKTNCQHQEVRRLLDPGCPSSPTTYFYLCAQKMPTLTCEVCTTLTSNSTFCSRKYRPAWFKTSGHRNPILVVQIIRKERITARNREREVRAAVRVQAVVRGIAARVSLPALREQHSIRTRTKKQYKMFKRELRSEG